MGDCSFAGGVGALGRRIRIERPQRDVQIIGFDSAWGDQSLGAICALDYDEVGQLSFEAPRLVDFKQGIEFVRERQARRGCTLVAIDQPTIVPNRTGSRPVERVAASQISYVGGGVQPANTSKTALFGPNAPIWKFKSALAANEDAEKARNASDGVHLIEVFPVLALTGLNAEFSARFGAPKYNPRNPRKFNLQHWRRVAETLAEKARLLELTDLAQWSNDQARCSRPRKEDEDCLDAAICALIGAIWRMCDRGDSVVIGDLENGYMVSPVSDASRHRLVRAAHARGVCFG